MYRLTIKDILEATGGVLLCGDENTEIKDVCINSKEIKPGDLFVPIIGERVDAHRFIESALHTGAATLTSQHTDIVVSEKPFVYVSDTEKALQDIGAYVRRKFKKPVIGKLPAWHTWDPTDPTAQKYCKEHKCHKYAK